MRSRVNLCRALLKDTDILYLDEPTSGLDPATTEQIHSLIEEEKARGTTIFLTTHNMHEAEKLCDRIFLLNGGQIIEEGLITHKFFKRGSKRMKPYVFETMNKSISSALRPDISKALRTASVPRSSRFSSVITCLVFIPVRGKIHSSLVSRNPASISFVTTFFGSALPVPMIFIYSLTYGISADKNINMPFPLKK